MSLSRRLVIPFDTYTLDIVLYLFPVLIMIFSIYLFGTYHFYLTTESSYEVFFFLPLIFCMFALILLFIAFSFAIYLKNNKQPMAILDKKGIDFKFYGFIPWRYIIEARESYISTAAHIKVVEIHIDRSYQLFKQISPAIRLKFILEKLLGHKQYRIVLQSFSISTEDIIFFTSKYINNIHKI